MKRKVFFAGTLSLILLLAIVITGYAEDTNPPVELGAPVNNPTCTSLGYDFGFKIDPPDDGTYTIYGEFLVRIAKQETALGQTVDWTSTLGMDAVIVKGGDDFNLYEYSPEAKFGSGLHAPINASGKYANISHLEFCYDYEVIVKKTAKGTFTRTHEWDIDKSVKPATWDLFLGDEGVSEYQVTILKTGYTDSEFNVSGTVGVRNPAPIDAVITSITDVIDGTIPVSLNCGQITFPFTLAPGNTLVCTYSIPMVDNSAKENKAFVTTSGLVGGGEAAADIVFVMTKEVNKEVNITDTNGMSWKTSDSAIFKYEKTFACGEDEGEHINKAKIVETGDEDYATVQVKCYDLKVEKTAKPWFDRKYQWTIDKTGSTTSILLSDGQTGLLNYAVTVDVAGWIDSGWKVTGDIIITNPHPTESATLQEVIDHILPADLFPTVTCPVLSIPAGEKITCTYEQTLPDGTAQKNVAKAVLINHKYLVDGTMVQIGTTNFVSDEIPFAFITPTTEIDKCVMVVDDQYGNLGEVCYPDVPVTFNYSLVIGPYDVCGKYEFKNIATFTTKDTGVSGSDSWIVTIDVPCLGCTLTPGYWKTHSIYGPAPYDENWLNIGEDTIFFLSGKSWYQVLWTAPQGNAYYILAHAYIAAKLNILDGAATTPDVVAAMTWAETFFSTYAPTSTLSRTVRNTAIAKATILDNYNNGYIGPGHCTE